MNVAVLARSAPRRCSIPGDKRVTIQQNMHKHMQAIFDYEPRVTPTYRSVMTSHPWGTAGPMVLKRILARELRTLREEAGLPLGAAMTALGCSRAKATHLETGRNLPTLSDLRELLRLYGVPERVEEFTELRAGAAERGWWTSYRLSPIVSEYIGLESDAVRVERFTLEIVPGMLQTEGYRRVVVRPAKLSRDEENRYIEARLRRGDRLWRGEVTLSAVMSEAVLRQTASMGDAGAEQLQHLYNATAMPNVTVRVLPFSAGVQQEASGSFTLLTFPQGLLAPVVHQDQANGDTLTENPDIVKRLQDSYLTSSDHALPAEESVAFIKKLSNKT